MRRSGKDSTTKIRRWWQSTRRIWPTTMQRLRCVGFLAFTTQFYSSRFSSFSLEVELNSFSRRVLNSQSIIIQMYKWGLAYGWYPNEKMNRFPLKKMRFQEKIAFCQHKWSLVCHFKLGTMQLKACHLLFEGIQIQTDQVSILLSPTRRKTVLDKKSEEC